MNKKLFFLAILPPEHISKKLTLLKFQAKEMFNAQHALNSPPHITLISPFWMNIELLSSLKKSINSLNATISSFEVQLNSFGYFEPNVLFVHVEPSENLNKCFKKCKTHIEEFLDTELEMRNAYHPHATIAFKDLDPNLLETAFQHFSKKDFKQSFTFEKIELLSYDKGNWNVIV